MGLTGVDGFAGDEVFPHNNGVPVTRLSTIVPLTLLYWIDEIEAEGETIAVAGSSIGINTAAPADEREERRTPSAQINNQDRLNCMHLAPKTCYRP